MSTDIKNFFSTTRNVAKRSTVGILCMITVAWTTVLPAQQITREQADEIVKNHLQSEGVESNHLYINVNAPDVAGIAVTTSNDEVFRAKYACWAYYLNENEQSQSRYLFVKEDDGNLLEVIAENDAGQSDLTEWKTLDVSVVEIDNYPSLPQIYPNPTNGELHIVMGRAPLWENGVIDNVEIHDIMDRKQELIINYSFDRCFAFACRCLFIKCLRRNESNL